MENRRLAAVLVLKELLLNAPTQLYAHMDRFLKCIWVPLRETKSNIREAAAEALEACLDVLASREMEQREGWYLAVWGEVKACFGGSAGRGGGGVEAIHAGLLVCRSLAIKANGVCIFMNPWILSINGM